MYRYDDRAKASGRSYVQVLKYSVDPSAHLSILVSSSSICRFWPDLPPKLEAKQPPDKVLSSVDFGKRTLTGRNVPGRPGIEEAALPPHSRRRALGPKVPPARSDYIAPRRSGRSRVVVDLSMLDSPIQRGLALLTVFNS